MRAAIVAACLLTQGVRPAGADFRVVTLPAGTPSRRATSLATERRVAVAGSRLLAARRVVPSTFPGRLDAAYERAEARATEMPSVLLASQLDLQSPEAFDTVVIAPGTGARPQGAIVFLHGYAGNIGLICWLVALTPPWRGVTTYCPSLGFEGDWWSSRGSRTLAATLRHARRQGARRIVLVGLSNGAKGASLLARRFRRQLAGLVLISGLAGQAATPGIPTLVVHGDRDPAVPAAVARRYVRRARARHVVVRGDHYVLLTREARVRAAITRWIKRRLHQEGRSPPITGQPQPS